MPYHTIGHDKHTYKDWILGGDPARTHVICLNAWKSQKRSTKEDQLLKITSGYNPNVPVLAVSKREEDPPWHPTRRRTVLVSSRWIMQDIRAMRWPVRKRHACCMYPGTITKSAKFYRNTLKRTSRSDLLNTGKPAPAATNAEKLSSLSKPKNRQTSRNIMMDPSQEIKREKSKQ